MVAELVGPIVVRWSVLGQFHPLASAGHVYKMEVLAFSMVSLVFIEKGCVSARGQIGMVVSRRIGRADDARTAGRRLTGWTFFGSIRVLTPDSGEDGLGA